ncbi:MAG: aldo/keto reductase [Acidobacteria bacterium]|nr:aldo/keto reductase [Acidobacteriota bacterium]
MGKRIERRRFVTGTAALAGSLAAGALRPAAGAEQRARRSILNFNENMEYRPLGHTGLMVSAVCMGGHWKRVEVMLKRSMKALGYSKADYDLVKSPDFQKNRHDVVSRLIEVGINYVDACAGPEVLAYSHALKGRRQKMYLGFSWFEREPRFPEWRTGKRLIEGLDMSLKEAGLDYVDLWRMTMPADDLPDMAELTRIEEAAVEAMTKAKQQGKVRFTGMSTHNRVWLKSMIEQYPKQMDVVLFPYTAKSKELPVDSLFHSIQKRQVGAFGIKPFSSNALFQGNSSPNAPSREEDDRRARLAIRYILGNTAVTAPIPGLVNLHQVDNVAKAVAEHRQLDGKEKAELDHAAAQMWTRLQPDYGWLKNWEYV